MPYNNIYHPIIGIIKRTTEKAILLVVTDPEALTDEDAEIENWIPKSQIASMTPMKDVVGNTEVRLSEWIIGQKDLKRFIRHSLTPSSSPANIAGHPQVPKNPPAPSFVDMDDDIPF